MKLDPARTFRDLIVWRKAHEFVLWVYRFTRKFPRDELYGLTSQFRRSGCIYSGECRRGLQEKKPERQSTVYEYFTGIA